MKHMTRREVLQASVTVGAAALATTVPAALALPAQRAGGQGSNGRSNDHGNERELALSQATSAMPSMFSPLVALTACNLSH